MTFRDLWGLNELIFRAAPRNLMVFATLLYPLAAEMRHNRIAAEIPSESVNSQRPPGR